MAPKIKVNSNNRFVLPAEIREKLGIKPGDTLHVELREYSMVVSRESESEDDFKYKQQSTE